MLFRETILLGDAVATVELNGDGAYRLAYADLVVYENGRRRVRGRTTPYEPRSVEQLRYDFERDVETAGGTLG
jgi:hypothetical protein